MDKYLGIDIWVNSANCLQKDVGKSTYSLMHACTQCYWEQQLLVSQMHNITTFVTSLNRKHACPLPLPSTDSSIA